MTEQTEASSNSTRRPTSERLTAVVDIGSNSVRLVVYQGLTRMPHVLFNERVLCGLGRDVSKTGSMDDDSMAMALATLRRFAELCRDMKIDDTEAVATAAVRDAENGPAFAARIEAECGFQVRVLSGDEEARLSALGVICADPGAAGIVGDLGGGSLELARISGGKVGDCVSLPIGPVRLLGGRSKSKKKDEKKIAEALASVSWLGKNGTLYLVGGAWRAIARLHINATEAPLPIMQGYRLSGAEMRSFADSVIGARIKDMQGGGRIPKRRRRTLSLAAWTLVEILKKVEPKEVVISALGIREGLLFGKLDPAVQMQDPLLVACKDIADRTGRFPEHADKLMAWIEPLFVDETLALRRLRFVTCLLSDVSWKDHPNFRAELAFQEAFFGRFLGIEHQERAIVAYALFRCFGGPVDGRFVQPALSLMSKDDMRYATVLGLSLRLGQRLTGGTAKPLEYSSLSIEDNALVLHLPEIYRDLAGGSVASRLRALAEALGVEVNVALD